ncbi:MAG: hypothetical protein MK226_23780 [Saprospiraceae bacterium]|nr:hypothetical protein [Saprospiraceae bacterium]
MDNESDEQLQKVLTNLCALYALHTIEKHRAWFLEHEYFMPAKSKAIRFYVDELCGLIRKDASALVDAFAIPSSCLAAPII